MSQMKDKISKQTNFPPNHPRLTAFVAKSLTEAGRHIEVEPEVVAKAVEWLMQQQAVDGSFPEVGTVVNEAMQGGAAFGSALTAYVVMALLTTQVLLTLAFHLHYHFIG